MNQYEMPKFSGRPCEKCAQLENENVRLLRALETVGQIATDMLNPIKRRGPSEEMRRTFERRSFDLALQESGDAGADDVAHVEEEL